MKNLLYHLDPETYGIPRTPITLGLLVAVVATVICRKLLDVLHEAGVPLGQ